MRKYITGIDLKKEELQNTVVHKLAAAPGSPTEGQIYYDTVLKEFGVYNGSAWQYSKSLTEATETVLGGIKLAGDLKGGTGAAPQVTNLHLAADTAINHKLTEVSEPTLAKDAATKGYVDGKVNGLTWKQAVEVATAAALPAYTQSGTGPTGQLEATANGALTIDGIAVTTNMRILVKNAVEAKHNGLYTAVQAGGAAEKFKLVRSADMNTEAQSEDATVLVHQGTANTDKVYNVANAGAIVVDTTAITWVEIQSGTAVVGDETYTTREGAKIALKPQAVTPTLPAEGEASAVSKGAARIASFAIKGNAVKTEWTVTHNLNTKLYEVQGQENSGGEPAAPIELDWVPGTANTVVITFPKAPAAGTCYFISVIG